MRLFPIRRIFMLLCVGSLLYALLHIINNQLGVNRMDFAHRFTKLRYDIENHLMTYKAESYLRGMPNTPREQLCVHPKLELNNKDLEKYYKHVSPIVCDPEADWVEITGSIARITDEALQKHGDVECTFTDIIRENDELNKNGLATTTHTDYELRNSDFVRVKCKGSDYTWKNIMAGIHNDVVIHQESDWDKVPKDSLQLNILMFGFDSLSRLHFIRKLPKTYKYLVENLKAVVLEGYNIVGDGTPQALIPILTGKTELELPETRRRMGMKASYVDVYPWIWKDFKKSGYVTGYMEDTSSIGTFTYRLKGFKEVPTDHYMRPFFLAADPEFSAHKKYCLRATPKHQVFMNYAKNFFKVYKYKPKFMFGFHGELSHDDLNLVEVVDDDFLEMLEDLHRWNFLNDTLLIIMSDHGHRFANVRETQQGKQEERLPMFSFTFPPWFSRAYPEAYKNFVKNSKRLTTPFDIHATLSNVLHFETEKPVTVQNRSISLFKEVPLERSCIDADIEDHWCACLNWEELSMESKKVEEVAQAAVEFLNDYTSSDRDKCAILSLAKTVWAGKLIPNNGLLKFKKNADVDGFVPDLTDNTKVSEEIYQVHIHTTPGDGHFEVSIKYNVENKSYEMKTSDVSRVNKYGSQAHCIQKTNLEIRKFCYCKDQLLIS